jgi:hypothetical protein
MENLRVRYVITYRSAGDGDMSNARTVRIELIDPTTGGPLEIVDANGMPVRWTSTSWRHFLVLYGSVVGG